MSRNFPNFLEAYVDYAKDNYVPDRFHTWVGLSILAAAIERKITLKNGKIFYVPNLYVMLVSPPAVGKSTSMDAGVDLLEQMKVIHKPEFRIIPNQITDAALVDMMKIKEIVAISPTASLPQSAGFFYASEASASALQNVHGNFTATLTALYDCPKRFRKTLKSDLDKGRDGAVIEDACMNVLAGTTFDFLKVLVNDQSVMGGFASRITYVVSEERTVKETKWGSSRALNSDVGRKLIDDLGQINRLVGPMRPTDGFIKLYEEWKPKFDQYIIDLNSERLQAIMGRKGTTLIKVAMLLSVADGDSLIVTENHFTKALELIEDVYKDNPRIIAAASIANVDSQKGTNQLILNILKRHGGVMPKKVLLSVCSAHGNDVERIRKTIDYFIGAGMIEVSSDGHSFRLLVDPDSYL